jgi:hypothetical protein
MTDREAREELELLLNWTAFPALSEAEVDYLYKIAKRKDINRVAPDQYEYRKASTAYVVGDQIVTDPRNGFLYECTVAGTSAAVSPDFDVADVVDETVVDGTVTWKNVGTTTWVPTFNVAYALSKGWGLKAGKVATAVDVREGDQTLNRSQMFKMLMAMKEMWGKVAGQHSTITLQGSLRTQLSIFPITNASTDIDLAQALYGVEILELSGWAIPGRVHWQDY